MPEFFITARSFAAPIVSDTTDGYVTGETAAKALERFASEYDHPCGLYAAEAWESADAFHKRQQPLARWESNKCRADQFPAQHADPTAGSVVA